MLRSQISIVLENSGERLEEVTKNVQRYGRIQIDQYEKNIANVTS